jgi:hypothetical protein
MTHYRVQYQNSLPEFYCTCEEPIGTNTYAETGKKFSENKWKSSNTKSRQENHITLPVISVLLNAPLSLNNSMVNGNILRQNSSTFKVTIKLKVRYDDCAVPSSLLLIL